MMIPRPIVLGSVACLAALAGCIPSRAVPAPAPPAQTSGGATGDHHYVPAHGFVPDTATAMRVAEAVLVPIYGQGNIDRQKPLTARLDGDRWTVTGTLPRGSLGGVALVQISKADARILRVTHGR